MIEHYKATKNVQKYLTWNANEVLSKKKNHLTYQ